jgi:hypothetical protein
VVEFGRERRLGPKATRIGIPFRMRETWLLAERLGEWVDIDVRGDWIRDWGAWIRDWGAWIRDLGNLDGSCLGIGGGMMDTDGWVDKDGWIWINKDGSL